MEIYEVRATVLDYFDVISILLDQAVSEFCYFKHHVEISNYFYWQPQRFNAGSLAHRGLY